MIQMTADFREQECFFFSKISKKKKKKKIIIFFFQNRFKKVITFPKWHADNFLEISPIVKTSYAFRSWICLWRFFDKIGDFREQRVDFWEQTGFFCKEKKFFQNRFKKGITFPKRHADNFLEIFPIVKTPYAFSSWICLWRFFDKIWEQECFFREQECFFFSKISKKKKKKKKIIFFFQNRFKKVITFPKRHAD